jgi:preprotein translocase SecE subunit
MSSKSKRKHANKQYNRANNKPINSAADANDEPASTAAVTGEVASVTAAPAVVEAILTPKEFRKLEKEKLKRAKLEAKTAKKADMKKGKKEAGKKKKPFAFVGEIGSELKKVHWPTFKQTVKATGVVLGVVTVFALITLGIDRLLGFLYELLMEMQGEGA